MKLIINADDYGYTKGINQGIRHGMLNGIITSTTVLTNCDISQEDCSLLKSIKNIGIGLHLNLTLEKPLTQGKSIQDDTGNFYDRKNLNFDQLDLEEVEIEFRAQINRFIELFNHLPSHFDSHHSIHDHPRILPITLKLMQEYQLPARRLSNSIFINNFFGQNATIETLTNCILSHKKDDCIEIMTHAGYSDEELERKSSYSKNREVELNILTHQTIKKLIEQEGIELSYYGK